MTENSRKHLDIQTYEAFREHSTEHKDYLRLHHAIYLQCLLEKNPGWNYADLAPWMRSTLNRFFELVDRVALTACQLDSWHEKRSSDIVYKGESWIDSLLKEEKLLKLEHPWGSPKTRHLWKRLADNLTSVLTAKFKSVRYTGTPPQPYEIFSGGFEYVPTVGLFPFYLFGERFSTWGIVKYGKLKSLGLATNEITAERLTKDIGVQLSPPEALQSDSVYSISGDDFRKIMNGAEDQGIKLFYFGAGHAAVALMLRLLDPSEYWNFRRLIKPLPSIPNQNPLVARADEGYWIVLSDLGDKTIAEYLENRPTNARLLTIEKDLEVPVGLGFSLAALPKLLTKRQDVEGMIKVISDWNKSIDDRERASLKSYDGIEILPTDKISIPSPWLSNVKAAEQVPTPKVVGISDQRNI
jgi:hypothetical protein